MGWFDKHPVHLESTTTPPPPSSTTFTRCAHNHSKKERTWAKTASSMPILICYGMILFSSLVFISFLSRHWAIPENIDTGLYHERLLRFPKGRGGFRIMESSGHWGGIYDWKSEGMGEFHWWDFWSRKCRVSSLKTLLLWTFVVRK